MTLPTLCTVGAGCLSTRRIYPYLGSAGARLVGVCDLNDEKAHAAASRWGGRVYTDLGAMLEVEHPDGVVICTGPRSHATLAAQVMRAGVPVYTEKPPASSTGEALELARVSRTTGKLCMTAFKKRYTAAAHRARAFLAEFDSCQWRSLSIDYASGGYPDKPDGSSDFLFDFAIHAIDLVTDLFGEVRQVSAFANGPGTYGILLRFRNGAVGVMNLTRARSFVIPTEEVEISVEGGNFMTIHNSSTWRIARNGKACEWREPPTFVSAGDSGHETGHLAELQVFVKAIRDGENPRSTIDQSYKTMVLYEAILEASARQRIVDVHYPNI